MSRTPKFALGLAAFGVGVVVAPVVAVLLSVDIGLPAVAAVALAGSLLVGAAGYALGTDDRAARVGASRVVPALIWIPAVFAVSLVVAAELTGTGVDLALIVGGGVAVGFFGGAAAWGTATSEHARRTTAGEPPVATWEARPRATWWRDKRVLGGAIVVALVAYFVLAVAFRAESSELSFVLTVVVSGTMGVAMEKNRRRTYSAYEHGVTVETNGATVFYDWDRIEAIDRTAGGLIMRRGWGPLTDLETRADDVADPDELAATLRKLRESRTQ